MKGIIYIIKELSTEEILYVGSTSMPLSERKHQHVNMCFEKMKTSPIYLYIREKCDRDHFNDNFSLEAVKEVELDNDNREELRKAEQAAIEELKPKYNVNRAYRSEEDLKEDHQRAHEKWNKKHTKEERAERVRKWQKANKDKVKEYRHIYYLRVTKQKNNSPGGRSLPLF